jgi:hypothetical protein
MVINIKQKYTSEKTSINTLKSVYKKIVGKYPLGTSILDIGCGKFDTNKEFADSNGFAWFGIDPYNRTPEYNDDSLNALYDWCDAPDIIMLNNVLNVLAEDKVLMDVLGQVYDYAGDDTDIYITIYEGNKSGIGKVTTKGYQRNQKLKEYKDYILEWFDVIDIQGNILKLRKVVE